MLQVIYSPTQGKNLILHVWGQTEGPAGCAPTLRHRACAAPCPAAHEMLMRDYLRLNIHIHLQVDQAKLGGVQDEEVPGLGGVGVDVLDPMLFLVLRARRPLLECALLRVCGGLCPPVDGDGNIAARELGATDPLAPEGEGLELGLGLGREARARAIKSMGWRVHLAWMSLYMHV